MVFRAWSDGRVEYRHFFSSTADASGDCNLIQGVSPCGWRLFSDPSQGLTNRSDINFDAEVDGADLATLLNDWGNAPRQDIPPSDCPLALINPWSPELADASSGGRRRRPGCGPGRIDHPNSAEAEAHGFGFKLESG